MIRFIAAGSRVAYGLLIGGVGGVLYTGTRVEEWDLPPSGPLLFRAFFGGLGALLGGLVGLAAGEDETIQIEGRLQEEIESVKKKLRSKARIPNYQ